jgi:nitrate reductase gamma subunit
MIGDFIDGPLWYFSATVFVLGVIWRFIEVLRAGVARDFAPPRAGGTAGAVRTLFSRFLPRRTIARRGRVQLIAGYMFHLGLFVLLFFAAPHVDFIEARITGFGWGPLPNWAFILASEFAFAGLLLLLLYRLMHPVTRLLSSADDYIGSILIFVVMLTGCLALARSF